MAAAVGVSLSFELPDDAGLLGGDGNQVGVRASRCSATDITSRVAFVSDIWSASCSRPLVTAGPGCCLGCGAVLDAHDGSLVDGAVAAGHPPATGGQALRACVAGSTTAGLDPLEEVVAAVADGPADTHEAWALARGRSSATGPAG